MKQTLLFLFLIAGCISLNDTHKITNNAVEIHELKYSPNRNYCFVTYLLDVGARGSRLYKTLMPTNKLDRDLQQGHLPTGVLFKEWVNDTLLHVAYDPYLEKMNATGNEDLINAFSSKDTVAIQKVLFIVTERKSPDTNVLVK